MTETEGEKIDRSRASLIEKTGVGWFRGGGEKGLAG